MTMRVPKQVCIYILFFLILMYDTFFHFTRRHFIFNLLHQPTTDITKSSLRWFGFSVPPHSYFLHFLQIDCIVTDIFDGIFPRLFEMATIQQRVDDFVS